MLGKTRCCLTDLEIQMLARRAAGGLAFWAIHAKGATQLLRLRSRAQLSTQRGRLIFRVTAAQIV